MKLHMGYLRSLEDSERTRAACVTYLQNWLVSFYPSRMDLVQQMEQMARDLGGHVNTPHLSWKYSWIRAMFGWPVARRSQLALQGMKASMARHWDSTLFRLEKRKLAGNF
jgi:hypothetical protein